MTMIKIMETDGFNRPMKNRERLLLLDFTRVLAVKNWTKVVGIRTKRSAIGITIHPIKKVTTMIAPKKSDEVFRGPSNGD